MDGRYNMMNMHVNVPYREKFPKVKIFAMCNFEAYRTLIFAYCHTVHLE